MTRRKSVHSLVTLRNSARLLWVGFGLVSLNAGALVPMADEELSGVSGQDGVTISINAGEQITADSLVWEMDAEAIQEGLFLTDITADFVGDASVTLDAGTVSGQPQISIGAAWTDLEIRIDQWGHTYHRNATGDVLNDRSVGIFGIKSTGTLDFAGVNSSQTLSSFDLNTSGDLYYRQSTGDGAPEISFGDISLGMSFSDGAGGSGFGSVGVTTDGIEIDAAFVDFDLNFDLYISPKTTAATYFDDATREPVILFGWTGGVKSTKATTGDPVVLISEGGVGYGAYSDASIDPNLANQFFNYGGQYATGTEGLGITVKWDYDSDFSWLLGQAAGERARAEFFEWRRLGAGTAGEADFDFRLAMLFDAFGPGRGPGGICFGGNIPTSGSPNAATCGSYGGSFENVAPDNGAMGVILRDGRLHAYNSRVRIIENVGAGTPQVFDTFDWSLLYTFGKLDANLYFYGAESNGGDGSLLADVLLAIQSPGYWEEAQDNFTTLTPGDDPRQRWATNTHFMIVDTDINNEAPANATPAQLASRDSFGIGILNADLFWRVDDFRITLVADSQGAVTTPGALGYYPWDANKPGMWIQTNNLAQYRFRGLFGGGDLADLSDPVRGALVDVNLQTDEFIFVLGPPRAPGETYVSFDAFLHFDGNTYVSLAEPSSPSADFTIGDISGSLAWYQGKIELKSSNGSGTGKPELSISNDILMGSTVNAVMGLTGDPLIGNVSLGSDVLGQMVIPSGQVYSSITLTPQ